jgi:hypothetical protein
VVSRLMSCLSSLNVGLGLYSNAKYSFYENMKYPHF